MNKDSLFNIIMFGILLFAIFVTAKINKIQDNEIKAMEAKISTMEERISSLQVGHDHTALIIPTICRKVGLKQKDFSNGR